MKRIITIVTALGIGLAGCGGDDDAADSVADTTVESTENTSTDTTIEMSSEESSEEMASGEMSSSAEPVEEMSSDDGTSEGASGNGDPIRTVDEIPKECRDEMASFLREIEPIVSPIDWETASIADFESIADDFTAQTAEFEAASAAAECNDLVFEEGGEFELLVDFAEQEAPGVVGFFEFLEIMRAPSAASDDGSAAGDSEAVTLETCADGIAFMEDLLAEYDTIRDVPASQLATFQQLPPVLSTCTATEAEFFSREDVDAFLDE